jgi:hypothetical protein
MKLAGLIIFCTFLISNAAFAELMFNTAKMNRKGGFSTYFVASKVGYQNGSDFDIERKILGGDYSIPVAKDTEFVIQAGLVFDAEVDNSSSDGQGFQLGGGGRMLMHATREVRLVGFGLINYLTETYDNDVDLSTVDIHMGATALFLISPTVRPFAGLELALYSDGDIEYKTIKADIERDDLILINLGVLVPMSETDIFFELTIGGEQTITIGAVF